jgi:hypothetical protein
MFSQYISGLKILVYWGSSSHRLPFWPIQYANTTRKSAINKEISNQNWDAPPGPPESCRTFFSPICLGWFLMISPYLSVSIPHFFLDRSQEDAKQFEQRMLVRWCFPHIFAKFQAISLYTGGCYSIPTYLHWFRTDTILPSPHCYTILLSPHIPVTMTRTARLPVDLFHQDGVGWFHLMTSANLEINFISINIGMYIDKYYVQYYIHIYCLIYLFIYCINLYIYI